MELLLRVGLWPEPLQPVTTTPPVLKRAEPTTRMLTTPAQMKPFSAMIPIKACMPRCFVDYTFNTQVLRVGTNFAFGLIQAIRFLEKHWSLLSHDIRTGTLNSVITDQSVRESVTKMIKPNQSLADFIEFECSRKSWRGIIQRLWPNTKYVECVITGSMAQYIPTLDYYSNGLPLVSTIYGASECYLGVNLNPLCNPHEVAYTLIPTMGYFEFLHVHQNDHRSKEKQLIDLANVKLDQEFEIVVTTYAGLYRYQLCDVLRVVGFKNKAPQFRFMCKKNVVLSIDADKTDEVELQKVVDNAVNHLVPFNVTLTEYTSYTDTSTIPGHYVIFWEINELAQVPPSVFETCCLTMEESLNTHYRYGRVSDKSIGPLEIKIVKTGTFDELMDYMVSLGGSVSQYKTPRCVKYEPIVKLLNERVVSSYFSPSCPNTFRGTSCGTTLFNLRKYKNKGSSRNKKIERSPFSKT